MDADPSVLMSQYPEQDSQQSLCPVSLLQKSVVLVMLAEVLQRRQAKKTVTATLNRYFIIIYLLTLSWLLTQRQSSIALDSIQKVKMMRSNTKAIIFSDAIHGKVALACHSSNPYFSFIMKEHLPEPLCLQANRNINVSSLPDSVPRQKSVHSDDVNCPFGSSRDAALDFLRHYQPLDISYPIQTLRQSLSISHKKYNRANYYGELSNGKRNGHGIMLYNDSRIFEGIWKNDLKDGQGTQRFPDESTYQGNYQAGVFHGQGKYQWNNEQVYQGQWRNGERHGSGTWSNSQGDSYTGEWRLGHPDGFGIYSSSSGVYEGEFKASLKHGIGVQKFSNGDMYRGAYANNKPSGEGSYYWENGSYFKGSFVNGFREGKGFWKRGVGNVDKYEGDYKNDKKWGYGQFTWASGNRYKGNYSADLRHGYGEIYWAGGGWYKGEWLSGMQHGVGQLYIPGAGLVRGLFDNNSLVQPHQKQKPIQKVEQFEVKGNVNTITAEKPPAKRLHRPQRFHPPPIVNTLSHSKQPVGLASLQSAHSHQFDSSELPQKQRNSQKINKRPLIGNHNNTKPIAEQSQTGKTIAEYYQKGKSLGSNLKNVSGNRSVAKNRKSFHISQKRRLHSSYHFYKHKMNQQRKDQHEINSPKLSSSKSRPAEGTIANESFL